MKQIEAALHGQDHVVRMSPAREKPGVYEVRLVGSSCRNCSGAKVILTGSNGSMVWGPGQERGQDIVKLHK